MTDGFVNIWVEERNGRYHAIIETGDGKRTISPPFRTERGANARAEKALRVITSLHPDADVTARDQGSGEKPEKSAAQQPAESDVRHEVPEP